METDSVFRLPMAAPVSRLTRITTIGLTPIIQDTTPTSIIPDIILIGPTWDGVAIQGINNATITISIGVTIEVIIRKTTIMAINEAINGVAMVDTIETIIARIAMDANGGDELIVRTGGPMGREIKKPNGLPDKIGSAGILADPFFLVL